MSTSVGMARAYDENERASNALIANSNDEVFEFEDEEESAADRFAKEAYEEAERQRIKEAKRLRMKGAENCPPESSFVAICPPEAALFKTGVPRRGVLSEPDILERISEVVADTVSKLEVPPEVAECLLRYCKWDSNALADEYFESKEKVFKKANFPPNPRFRSSNKAAAVSSDSSFLCPLLCIDVPIKETSCLPCGHRFSNDCWEGYLASAIDDQATCLGKRCPSDKCPEVVSCDFWKRFLSTKQYFKFHKYRISSFVAESEGLFWCPAEGCRFAVERLGDSNDLNCLCTKAFCCSCHLEPHTPVPCSVVQSWTSKYTNETQNVNWILVNAKFCPGCKQPIQKNQGCNTMTCRCSCRFCWLCLGTGGYEHRCNAYSPSHSPSSQGTAKADLERYTHHFERYKTHDESQKKTSAKKVMQSMQFLQEMVNETLEVDFLQDAVLQIIECRRFLKWTYAYGYFTDWKATTPAAKQLFEYQQGLLEAEVDVLHGSVEQFSPETYVGESVEWNPKSFLKFKDSLICKTTAVKKFFNNMSKAFENDFIGAV